MNQGFVNNGVFERIAYLAAGTLCCFAFVIAVIIVWVLLANRKKRPPGKP